MGWEWQTVVIFLLGVVNFALNRAVFDSRHPLFARLPRSSQRLGSRTALFTEFVVLFLALMLSVNGWPGFVWAYLAYTAVNGVAAWLILGRRV